MYENNSLYVGFGGSDFSSSIETSTGMRGSVSGINIQSLIGWSVISEGKLVVVVAAIVVVAELAVIARLEMVTPLMV